MPYRIRNTKTGRLLHAPLEVWVEEGSPDMPPTVYPSRKAAQSDCAMLVHGEVVEMGTGDVTPESAAKRVPKAKLFGGKKDDDAAPTADAD